jgi:hypothetical protein
MPWRRLDGEADSLESSNELANVLSHLGTSTRSSRTTSASLVAMDFAASGYLPPVPGALVHEVIDVGVILNALRALPG